jgi:hypothetical protein
MVVMNSRCRRSFRATMGSVAVGGMVRWRQRWVGQVGVELWETTRLEEEDWQGIIGMCGT